MKKGPLPGTYDKVYRTRSYNGKEKVKYLVWTSEMDHDLAKVLVEQVKMGNKKDGILKTPAFIASVKSLNEKFGLYLTKEHIKNRLKTWKKQFGVLKHLLSQEGFEWNEACKMVVADNSLWNDYIKVHPDARQFRAKFIENYDELCVIIGKNQAIVSCSDCSAQLDTSKEGLDAATVPEICSDNKHSKNLQWTEEMDLWLGNFLVEKVEKGDKIDDMLQQESWNLAVLALNEKFGSDLTEDHIKDRLRNWKKHYGISKELLSHAGFKWDETKKMMSATDSVWSNYVKTHPDAKILKGRVIENYHHMCFIFGNHNEAIDATPIQCGGQVKEQVKNMMWTNEMDRCLSKVLVEQVKLGNKSRLNKFNTAAYIAAVSALNERFQLDLTKEHVKNRLKTWKKQYEIMKELLDHSDFQWDKTQRMVVANDSAWNQYLRKNHDTRHLRARLLDNYDELCVIVGKEQPSEQLPNARTKALNPTGIAEENVETPLQMLVHEEMSQDDSGNDIQGSSEQTRVRPSSSDSEEPCKRRRTTTSDTMLEMMNAMAANIGRIADALAESNRSVCMDEVFEIVQMIPGFDDDLIIDACEYLSFDQKRARMFMKLDQRLRKLWLLKRLRG